MAGAEPVDVDEGGFGVVGDAVGDPLGKGLVGVGVGVGATVVGVGVAMEATVTEQLSTQRASPPPLVRSREYTESLSRPVASRIT